MPCVNPTALVRAQPGFLGQQSLDDATRHHRARVVADVEGRRFRVEVDAGLLGVEHLEVFADHVVALAVELGDVAGVVGPGVVGERPVVVGRVFGDRGDAVADPEIPALVALAFSGAGVGRRGTVVDAEIGGRKELRDLPAVDVAVIVAELLVGGRRRHVHGPARDLDVVAVTLGLDVGDVGDVGGTHRRRVHRREVGEIEQIVVDELVVAPHRAIDQARGPPLVVEHAEVGRDPGLVGGVRDRPSTRRCTDCARPPDTT